MASRKRLSVWETLRRLGHRGDGDVIVRVVFEARPPGFSAALGAATVA